MTRRAFTTFTPFTAYIACPLALALLLASGCASLPGQRAAGTAPAATPTGLLDVLSRPAERALAEGLRAYDEAQYPTAEAALRKALATGLASPRDRAGAHKLLAFISCSSQRLVDCEAAFVAARAADAGFALSRSEAGHPLWGPVYRRVLPAVEGATPPGAPATTVRAGGTP